MSQEDTCGNLERNYVFYETAVKENCEQLLVRSGW
jgi:hypothetical protein